MEATFHPFGDGCGCDLDRRCVCAKKLDTPYGLHSMGARIDEITCAPSRKPAESARHERTRMRSRIAMALAAVAGSWGLDH